MYYEILGNFPINKKNENRFNIMFKWTFSCFQDSASKTSSVMPMGSKVIISSIVTIPQTQIFKFGYFSSNNFVLFCMHSSKNLVIVLCTDAVHLPVSSKSKQQLQAGTARRNMEVSFRLRRNNFREGS